MSLFSRILWFLAFLVATFCWMVLFQHGFSMRAFSTGVAQELRELAALVTRSSDEPGPSAGSGSAEPRPSAPAPSPGKGAP